MPAKEINLLPQKNFDKTPIGRILRWALTYGRYIIICTEIIVLLAFIYRFTLDRQITDLNEEIEQKSAIVEANLGFETQFRNLQRRVTEIGALISDQDVSVQVLKHLEQITPSGIQFGAFSYANGKVNIDATAVSNVNLALFLNNLKNSAILKTINVTSLSQKGAGTGEILFKMEASAVLPKAKATQDQNNTDL